MVGNAWMRLLLIVAVMLLIGGIIGKLGQRLNGGRPFGRHLGKVSSGVLALAFGLPVLAVVVLVLRLLHLLPPVR